MIQFKSHRNTLKAKEILEVFRDGALMKIDHTTIN